MYANVNILWDRWNRKCELSLAIIDVTFRIRMVTVFFLRKHSTSIDRTGSNTRVALFFIAWLSDWVQNVIPILLISNGNISRFHTRKHSAFIDRESRATSVVTFFTPYYFPISTGLSYVFSIYVFFLRYVYMSTDISRRCSG